MSNQAGWAQTVFQFFPPKTHLSILAHINEPSLRSVSGDWAIGLMGQLSRLVFEVLIEFLKFSAAALLAAYSKDVA